jgi:spermidine/putrescine-binding protein
MIKCYRDSNGYPRVETDTVQQNLAAFLEQDVQGSESVYQKFRDALDALTENGTDWSQSGNAHKVTLANDRVVIENLWDGDLVLTELSISEFENALEKWRHFVYAPPGM